ARRSCRIARVLGFNREPANSAGHPVSGGRAVRGGPGLARRKMRFRRPRLSVLRATMAVRYSVPKHGELAWEHSGREPMMASVLSFPLAVQVPVPTSPWDGALAVDLFAPCGTPATAVFDGNVAPAVFPLGGNTVTLTAADGTQAYYAHRRPGGRDTGAVRAGDVVGYVSNSGNANKRKDGQENAGECHLH